MKSWFLLEPEVAYLNHGSFGALPLEVLQNRQSLERRLAGQPARFLQRELFGLLEEARATLGRYLNADPMDLALIPNATTGVNIVARSIRLEAGDEVLLTDHEYGACDNIFNFVCQRHGASLIRQEVPVPPCSREELAEAIWNGVTD
ncbi:MAG TPA: aminotransferase class V-fold PLP-dependent enzyme, partial [Anaerolineales bacterium]|nr:aminotransferase class V-fold PLP-dependent enzyme [Anaerolineales bacterium]